MKLFTDTERQEFLEAKHVVGEREVRMLVTVTDQLAQTQGTKAVLGNDAVPDVAVVG
ncbi:hypothetical protein [Mycolicibacterium vulneris]|jgi:hypothetical protein|uniref:hypothetical protein n=1 Tax=Mycolicibacterium vulneris TaxID=547163 RepID=UPI0013FE2A22|nr:hypothetical protein [Mycolicibacterium vulneris]